MTLFLSHRDISVVDGLRRRGSRSADAFLGGCLCVHPRISRVGDPQYLAFYTETPQHFASPDASAFRARRWSRVLNGPRQDIVVLSIQMIGVQCTLRYLVLTYVYRDGNKSCRNFKLQPSLGTPSLSRNQSSILPLSPQMLEITSL